MQDHSSNQLYIHFQGKQTLFTYSCGRSFSPICMVIGYIFCCRWPIDRWIELWALYLLALHTWPFSWHHLLCSSIQNETFSCCSIPYYCHSMIYPPFFPILAELTVVYQILLERKIVTTGITFEFLSDEFNWLFGFEVSVHMVEH